VIDVGTLVAQRVWRFLWRRRSIRLFVMWRTRHETTHPHYPTRSATIDRLAEWLAVAGATIRSTVRRRAAKFAVALASGVSRHDRREVDHDRGDVEALRALHRVVDA
jgi:hypothetical protein